MTPLHVAAKKGECHEIVKYLIDKGTDINIQDDNGVSETKTGPIVNLSCCLKFIRLQALMQMSLTENLPSEIIIS